MAGYGMKRNTVMKRHKVKMIKVDQFFLHDNSCDYDRYQKDEGISYEASDCNVESYPERVSSTILYAEKCIFYTGITVLRVLLTKQSVPLRGCTRVATRLVYAFYSFRVRITTHS